MDVTIIVTTTFMASLTKKSNSKFWFACFRDRGGKQHRRSTGETNERKALEIARRYEQVAQRKLKPAKFRETLVDHARQRESMVLGPECRLTCMVGARSRAETQPILSRKYTLADYLELNLIERMQRHGDMEVKEPIGADFTSSQTQTEGISFWGRIVEKAKLKPSQHQLVHRLFCCYWDRFFVPFEFWTYPAMEACLTEILMEKHAIADSVRVGNLRQLVKRLKLQKSSHIIVRQFVRRATRTV